jgi:hypothetical protein
MERFNSSDSTLQQRFHPRHIRRRIHADALVIHRHDREADAVVQRAQPLPLLKISAIAKNLPA